VNEGLFKPRSTLPDDINKGRYNQEEEFSSICPKHLHDISKGLESKLMVVSQSSVDKNFKQGFDSDSRVVIDVIDVNGG